MLKEIRIMATTKDNPYSPFTDYSRWYYEDVRLGYDTNSTLAALTPPTSEIDDGADEEALRLLLEYNFSGNHIGVTVEDYDPLLKPQQFS